MRVAKLLRMAIFGFIAYLRWFILKRNGSHYSAVVFLSAR
jgi:hypothetical protein